MKPNRGNQGDGVRNRSVVPPAAPCARLKPAQPDTNRTQPDINENNPLDQERTP